MPASSLKEEEIKQKKVRDILMVQLMDFTNQLGQNMAEGITEKFLWTPVEIMVKYSEALNKAFNFIVEARHKENL